MVGYILLAVSAEYRIKIDTDIWNKSHFRTDAVGTELDVDFKMCVSRYGIQSAGIQNIIGQRLSRKPVAVDVKFDLYGKLHVFGRHF